MTKRSEVKITEPERVPLSTTASTVPSYPQGKRTLNCKTQPGTTEYVGAVVHFTAGRRGKPENTIAWANNTKDKDTAFTFCLIDADGTFYQTHDFDEWGWHAGPSSHPKLKGNLSKQLIGIEIAAAGLLSDVKVVASQAPGYPIGVCMVSGKAWFDKTPQAYAARYNNGAFGETTGWYEAFTPDQEASLVHFLMWAKANLKKFSFDYVVAHEQISPKRKQDPGAALSMPIHMFREFLMRASV